MSLIMFNHYMSNLTKRLNSAGVGYQIRGQCLNNISYANDMVLMAAFLKGLRILLKICEEFSEQTNTIYDPGFYLSLGMDRPQNVFFQ